MRTLLEKLELNLSGKLLFMFIMLDLVIIVLVLLSAVKGSLFLIFPLTLGIVLILFLNYKLSLYLLLVSLFLRYDIYLMGKYFVLMDLVSILLVFSFLGYFLMSGSFSIKKTVLDRSIFIFLAVLLLSLLNTIDLANGIRVYIWHLQVFSIYFLISWSVDTQEVPRFLKFFILLVSIHSVYTLFQFWLSSGRVRAFGLAGPSIADLTIGGLIICYSFFLFEDRANKRLTYGFLFLLLLGSLLATQTRGALMSFSLIYLILSGLALTKANRLKLLFFKRRILISLSLVVLGTGILLLVYPELLKRVHHGFYYLPGRYIETTQIRFYLWGLALKSFIHYPILGIGLGQFYNLVQVFPGLRFSPLVFYIYGLDPHNIVLYYLSSAGIFGIIAFFYFFLSVLKMGWTKFKRSVVPQDLSISFALLGIVLFVFISSFYTGEWFYRVSGIEFLFFMGLLNVFKPKVQ